MKKALWFLFSLKGRVSRVPFILFIMSAHLSLFILDQWAMSNASSQISAPYLIKVAIGWAVIWPLFAFTTKRLHDLNRRGHWALPILLSPLVAMASGYLLAVLIFDVGLDHAQAQSSAELPVKVLYYYALALQLFLALWPGTKGPNRYGPAPKEKTAPIEATFE